MSFEPPEQEPREDQLAELEKFKHKHVCVNCGAEYYCFQEMRELCDDQCGCMLSEN